MEFYRASDLEDKTLLPPQMIVEGLLPVGLTVLAGAPKTGKSWLILQLAYSVATGGTFLGRPTAYGDCLYIDLEGSQYRIKERMSALGYSFPQELQISHTAPALNDGLLDELEVWWACTNNPQMVIVDTVGRLKSAGNKTLNAYENDSIVFSPLQKFALEKKLAIILVTHLKKREAFSRTEDLDWVERITGSMGLAGCADALWGLFRKRNENTGFFRTTARDVEGVDLVCQFDNGEWQFVSDNVIDHEFRNSPIVQFISQLTSFHGKADALCDSYLDFCRVRGLPHGLSEKQPLTSFGRQMQPLIAQAWRINRTIIRLKRREGIYYEIGSV